MEIDVQISKDERRAFLTVISGEEDILMELGIDELLQSLSEKGVKYGVKEDTLSQICQLKKFNHKYLVAEAIPPKVGENGRIQIRVKPKERPTYDRGVESEERVDHFGEREGFITYVREGDILATRIPPTRGQNGFTVTGKEIPGIIGNDVSLVNVQGRNTKVVGNNLIAIKDGVLKKEKSKLHIVQDVILEKDLGIKSGSIILPLEADIEMIVPGDIKSGFTVQCSKIKVMGNVEDANVTAKIMEVKRGIVGTSDVPIVVDYLTANFITGTRKIRSKFINVKKEISGGSTIQADFVRSHIIQECTISCKYGIWTDYLYGKNSIWVGIDIDEQEEYNNWSGQLEGLDKALKKINLTNQSLLKKADLVREMAEHKPNNPVIKRELEKINIIVDKINKIERVKDVLKKKIQLHQDKMFIQGSPFILVGLDFTKKGNAKDKLIPINNLTIKEFSYAMGKPLINGLYTLKGEEVIVDSKYNIRDINEIVENYKDASLN